MHSIIFPFSLKSCTFWKAANERCENEVLSCCFAEKMLYKVVQHDNLGTKKADIHKPNYKLLVSLISVWLPG